MGLGRGDIGEGVLGDHGDVGGGGTVGAVVPALLGSPVPVVALSRLNRILCWSGGGKKTTGFQLFVFSFGPKLKKYPVTVQTQASSSIVWLVGVVASLCQLTLAG